MQKSIYFYVVVCCAFLLCEIIPSATKAQTQTSVEIVLAVNGSSSISDADFAIQKNGIVAALENEMLFPTDGIIAFGLVQYAQTTTQVHIPLTPITLSNRSNIVDKVNAIQQIGGATNPGDGIIRATNMLANFVSSNNKEIICLSTDGLPNEGADVENTAVPYAKSKGVERFTVVPIEDNGEAGGDPVYEDDFINFYGSLVFNEGEPGTVAVTKNATEFANLIGTTCLAKRARLVGIEVVQSIQDWNNSIPLIRGKTTYARLHVEAVDQPDVGSPFSARLIGPNGEKATAVTPPGINNSDLPGATIPLPANAAAERMNWESSLNFIIPKTWLKGGFLTLYVDAPNLDCQATPAVDDSVENYCGKLTLEVIAPPVTSINSQIYNVLWNETTTGSNYYSLTESQIEDVISRIEVMFPLADGSLKIDSEIDSFTTGFIDNTGLINTARLTAVLRLLNISTCRREVCDENTVFMGLISQGPLSNNNIKGLASGSTLASVIPNDNLDPLRHAVNHEFGHIFGLIHTVKELGIASSKGVCGEREQFYAERFPNFHEFISHKGLYEWPTIGPMNVRNDQVIFNDPNLIVGLDTNIENDLETSLGESPRVVNPTRNLALMSYCSLRNQRWSWISDHNYSKFITETSEANSAQLNSVSNTNLAEYLLVRGEINPDTLATNFYPAYQLSLSPQLITLSSGAYTLRLLDSNDTILEQISFDPEVFEPFGDVEPVSIFTVPVPYHSSAERVEIYRDNELIGTTFNSNLNTSVEVMSPNGGEYFGGDQITLNWQKADSNVTDLAYLVEYSADSGTTWDILAADWEEESITVNRSSLAGSNNALFRVTSSDGFDSTSDESDETFIVENNVPSIFLKSPGDQDLFVGLQPILLSASGLDTEDGRLLRDSIAWRSSLDGFLGLGDNFLIPANNLSEGKHILTATVTDSAGATASATTTIDVSRLFNSAASIRSTSPQNGEENVLIDTTLNITFSRSIDPGQGTIVIRRVSDNSLVESIDVTSPNVVITGATAEITPTQDLPIDTDLYVTFSQTTFDELVDGALTGFSWQFNTFCGIPFPHTVTKGIDDFVKAVECANETEVENTIDLNGATLTLTAPYAADPFGLGSTGLPVISAPLVIRNGTIERDNTASDFRLLITDTDTVLENMILRNGRTADAEQFADAGNGGAIFHRTGTLTVSGSIFENNYADTNGGAISNQDSMQVTDSTFRQNLASNNAGAVNNAKESIAKISSSEFADNATINNGGAIFNIGELDIENSSFIDNRADYQGGAICNCGEPFNHYGHLTLTDVHFTSNYAATHGGAIYSTVSNLWIINSELRANSASYGGVLYLSYLGYVNINNSLFSGNFSAVDGAAIFLDGTSTEGEIIRIFNSTFAGNQTSGRGRAVYQDGGTFTLDNSILWNNEGEEEFYIVNDSNTNVRLQNSIIAGGNPPRGDFSNRILDQDPLFADPVLVWSGPTLEGDYHISSISPAIDSASNTSAKDQDANVGDVDLDGNPRFYDVVNIPDTGEGVAPIIDMGAYEYQPIAVGPDVNDDGIISPTDAIYVLNRIDSNDLSADVNGDGVVDNTDVQIIQRELGQ